MAQSPDPPSRQERQQQTRAALLDTARMVFSEDGYHAARLERIAREAGFSKGAVYSNFAGKADLFLAVLDQNLELSEPDLHDPFGDPAVPHSTGQDTAAREGYPLEGARKFALATLEFIASAARDETLAPRLHQSLSTLLDHYREIAERERPDDETLPAADIGILLAALDQGAGLILLAGDVLPEPAVFNAGMRRLVDPGSTARPGPDT